MKLPRLPYVYQQAGWWLLACALLGAPIGAVVAWYRGRTG